MAAHEERSLTCETGPTYTRNESDKDSATRGLSSKRDYLESFVMFVLLGVINLLNWNHLLTVNGEVMKYMENEVSITDTVSTVYSVFTLLFTASMIRYNVANPFYTLIGIGVAILGVVSYTICAFLNPSVGNVLFHFVAAIMSLGSALIGCSGFGFASRVLGGFDSAMSGGVGLAGLLTLVLWYLAFNVFTSQNFYKSFLTVSITYIILHVVTLVTFYFYCKKPYVSSVFKKEMDRPVELEEEQTPFLVKFKKTFFLCKWTSLTLFLNLFITLFIFPNVIPVYSDSGNEFIFVAMFIIGDFIGRYLPIVPFLMGNNKFLYISSLSRLPFIAAIYIEIYCFTAQSLLRKFTIILLGITNGYTVTLGFMLNASASSNPKDSAMLGSIALFALQVGISLGQLLSVLISRYMLPAHKWS